MNVKQIALIETAKTVASLTVVAVIVNAIIFYVPIDISALVLGVGLVVYATRLIYDTKLRQAQVDEMENK
jgi:uncharacterized membrane protein